ncbi:MAG TPA: carboxypeptidase-like regulatory domain-containing protein, partial [Ardenticatenaceae bacterium]|nr:carboxypeptidase-like regulatory domain-containing protein [Ardenticatenaceae bacterium]
MWGRARLPFARWLHAILCLALLTASSPLSLQPDPVFAASKPTAPATPDSMPLRASQHWRAPRVPSDEPPDAPTGTVTGVVLNAATDRPLEGVRVSIGGSPPPEERGGLFLPLLMRGGARSVLAAPGTPQATGVISNTTTGPDGTFALALPAGVFTVTFSIANFTNDERLVAVTPYETSRVQDVRLHALDPNTEIIGSAGGTAVNSLGNSSVQFEPGSLATTEEVRVTYLPNDELPGPFPDGSSPMGFSAFEPEGVVFPQGKEVLWTVEYDGPLPVGTDTLCYWWDGKEGRWRDPVPGKVVDLGGGQKGLQARVPHFSAYGHAVPGIAGQRPGQGGNPSAGNPNAGQGPDQTPCDGCEINVGTGSVAESYDFPAVSGKGFPVALTARYSTANDTPEVTARVPFTITTQTPARATWRLVFQGKVYSGEGYTARATWDTRNAQGQRVAPGLYPFTAS